MKASPEGSEDQQQGSPSLAEGTSSLATSDIHSVDTPGVGGYHEAAASREAAKGPALKEAAGMTMKAAAARQAPSTAPKPSQPQPPRMAKLSVIMPRQDGSGAHPSSRLGPAASHPQSHPHSTISHPLLPRQPSSGIPAVHGSTREHPVKVRADDVKEEIGRADGTQADGGHQGLQGVHATRPHSLASLASSSRHAAPGIQGSQVEPPGHHMQPPVQATSGPEQKPPPPAFHPYHNIWDDDRPLSFPKALARKRT